jgi:hypothetical protein
MKKNNSQLPSMVIKAENAIGNITASGGASVNVKQQVTKQVTPEMDRLFKRVHKRIETHPPRHANPAKVQEQVKKIEKEAAKGEKADPAKLEGWLIKLSKMAPDILDVMLASLGGPVAGFTAVFKKIVDHAKAASTG